MPQKITTCLWFDTQALQAAKFYCSVFKKSKLADVVYYGDAGPGKKGSVMTVTFTLAGQKFMAVNGGPIYKFTPAISLSVECKSQKEIDALWKKLTASGGKEIQCGWLEDKYGLSWQIVPGLIEKHMRKNNKKSDRMMKEILKQKKLDIKALKKAYKGR